MGTFTLKYPYLKRISWPLFKEAFLRVFEIGWSWMHIRAWICWQGILLQNQFSLFLCILKPEALCTKVRPPKTPAQLHILKWNPDYTYMFVKSQRNLDWNGTACTQLWEKIQLDASFRRHPKTFQICQTESWKLHLRPRNLGILSPSSDGLKYKKYNMIHHPKLARFLAQPDISQTASIFAVGTRAPPHNLYSLTHIPSISNDKLGLSKNWAYSKIASVMGNILFSSFLIFSQRCDSGDFLKHLDNSIWDGPHLFRPRTSW